MARCAPASRTSELAPIRQSPDDHPIRVVVPTTRGGCMKSIADGWLRQVAIFACRAAAVGGLQISSPAAHAGRASVVLLVSASTSAGIFDSEDRLVRTLWSGRYHTSGAITVDWDGRDDDGVAMPDSVRYRARILMHNVRYVWEGVIGNTSAEFTGAHVHRALNPINDMAIDSSGHAFYVVGYDEQQNAINRFDTVAPQVKTALAHDDYRRVFQYAATDGTLAYFANVGLAARRGLFMREPATFVIALKVSDNTEYHFPHGRVDMPGGQLGNRWESVIDYDHDDVDDDAVFRSAPSGLAVQQRGDDLFVPHQQLDEVRVLDKRAGSLLDRIEISAPTRLAVAPDDSLWVLCQSSGQPAVVHLQRRKAHWAPSSTIVDGLLQPVAIGVSPVDGTLIVADAGR